MPLVFAAIVPHSPVLIPSIGKRDFEKAEKTIESLRVLEENLYLAKPHIIITFSSHSHCFTDAFSVNGHTKFESAFEDFGDHSLVDHYTGSPDFVARLSHLAIQENIPLRSVSREKVDHGVSVPLHYLTSHLPEVKIVPIGPCNLPTTTHLNFGKIIKEIAMESDKRVAILASADLSHTITTDAPAGFHESGRIFDTKIIELLESHNTAGIVTLDNAFVDNAVTCGYRSIVLTLGALQNMQYEFKNHSYEAPFGVGYLTAEFVFS